MGKDIVKVTLEDGFQVEVDKSALDDMEFVDALADLQQDDALAISRVCNKLFTPEQKKALYDKLRDENGRVPVKAFSEVMKSIFEALGKQGKN